MTKIPSGEESSKALFQIVREEWPEGEPLTNKKTNTFHDAFKEALIAEREAGAREERERIKKEITEQTLLNNDDDTFVKLSEALWVCDSKEDRDRFIQALTPPTK